MIMELPQNFDSSFATIENGILFISNPSRFEDLMYELTYSYKEWSCVYCNTSLTEESSTLDHRYPRDTGGVSITNNLFPCCHTCNSRKSNMLDQEYIQYCDTPKENKSKLATSLWHRNDYLMHRFGYKLPRKWIEFIDVDQIKYVRNIQDMRGKRYHRILEFYTKYQKIPRPVVVDKNFNLLDGYNIILFSHDFGITQVPVIRLENVELQ